MLTVLLSWYDEPDTFLDRAIHSLHHVNPDHLVALDGAYTYYPAGRPRSPQSNYDTINQAAEAIGVEATVVTPDDVWPSEMNKRTRLFQLGEQHTTPDDWYLILDADEQVTTAPRNLHQQLTDTAFDVAEATMRDTTTLSSAPFPKFFRAIPGLEVIHNHYTYRTPNNRYLWGNANTARLEPRHPLHDLTILHHTNQRPPQRDQARRSYYMERDQQHIESHTSPHLAA